MQQPEGFVVAGKEKCVYRLHKAIYGLKQASRAWKRHFKELLHSIRCYRSSADAGLYVSKREGHARTILIVYVDDIYMAGRRNNDLLKLATEIEKRSKLEWMRTLKNALG